MATTAFTSGPSSTGASGERSLPHNAEAERTVLGAILVDNQAFNSAAEILTRDDFYRDAHRRISARLAEVREPPLEQRQRRLRTAPPESVQREEVRRVAVLAIRTLVGVDVGPLPSSNWSTCEP